MRQHEHGMVEWRFVAPPTGPVSVTPGATNGTEHVATHDGGAAAETATQEERIVESFFATLRADHLSAAASREDPFVEQLAADPQRIVEILGRSGAEAVERDREVAD